MPWDAVDFQGRWVEIDDDTVHIVKEIERLWPELQIKYCENPDIGEAPYLLVERTSDGRDEAVMSIWQLDSRLLDLIHEADTTRHDVLKIVERNNDRAKAAKSEALLTWKDYCRDVIVSASRHIGSSYTFADPREGHEGETVKIEDDPARRTEIK